MPCRRHIAAAAILLAVVASATPSSAEDWPRLLFNNRNTGYNRHEHVIGPSNVGRLVPSWRTKTRAAATFSPIVAGPRIFIPTTQRIYALSTKTGRILWVSGTIGGTAAGIAIANGIVYVTVSGAREEGNQFGPQLQARAADTGRLLWRRWMPGTHAYSLPTVARGLVYASPNDDEGHFFAFDARTGRTVWSRETGGWTRSSPAIRHGVMYYAELSDVSRLVARDASTGRLLWSSRGEYVSTSARGGHGRRQRACS
jgi:outer membrane protein assembly factor BamB